MLAPERMQAVPFERAGWNALVASLPGAHVLQTWEWGQLKARYGWQPQAYCWGAADGKPQAAALVLCRSLPVRGLAARMRIFYLPKGPLLAWENESLRSQVLQDLHSLALRQGGIFLKIDPDVSLGTGIPGQAEAWESPLGQAVVETLKSQGWRFSGEQIQFRNTVELDLTPSEETLLANMKQKTRYNIRLAERRGVTVRAATPADLDLIYRMYAETSLRDGFVIRSREYYQDVWSTFLEAGLGEALLAEVESQPVAGLVIFRFAGRAWYMYGMSLDVHREKMPTYLLQWEAIRRAKAAGCRVYDLWGAPDVFDEHDSLWGVYRFKEGLGGQVVRHLGAWDLPVQPWLYRLYTQTLPRLLGWMRRRGKEQTRQALS